MGIHTGNGGGENFPTHYFSVMGGEFALDFPKNQKLEAVTGLSGVFEGVATVTRSYPSGKYAGTIFVEMQVRLRDGSDLFQINLKVGTIAATCMATYLDAMNLGDLVTIGSIADEKDPKMTKLYVKRGLSVRGEKVASIDRKGLDRNGMMALALQAVERAKGRGATFVPYQGAADSESQHEEPELTGFDEVSNLLFDVCRVKPDVLVLPKLLDSFNIVLNWMLRRSGEEPLVQLPTRASGAETYSSDHWRLIAQWLRLVQSGEKQLPPVMLELRQAAAGAPMADDGDPFADGAR